MAIDARAAAAGCAAGQALAEARAVCLALRVVPAEPHEDRRLLECVADWCDRYTPLVALDLPYGLLLDVSGCSHVFGGEAPLADDLRRAVEARGLSCRVAIASGAGPARSLAWFAEGGVAPENEVETLVAALPVAALGLDNAARTGLLRAGLKTIGDVAGRGRQELAARFGAKLVQALDVALAKADQPISPRRPAPCFVVERRFAEPILEVAAALSALRGLADALMRRLEQAGQGLLAAEAAFFRADGKVERVTLRLGGPSRDTDMTMRLFRERLDALADPLDPGFGYDLVRLSALEGASLTPKARAFDRRDEDAAALAELIDRLTARNGRARVLRWACCDAHRPESEGRLVPAQDFSEGALAWDAELGPPRRPLRLFAPPEPIEAIAEIPDGPPLRFVWRRVVHRVARAEGPERIALEWWRGDAMRLTRDYFRVEDEVGSRFWLYRDGLFGREVHHPRWFLHGLFS